MRLRQGSGSGLRVLVLVLATAVLCASCAVPTASGSAGDTAAISGADSLGTTGSATSPADSGSTAATADGSTGSASATTRGTELTDGATGATTGSAGPTGSSSAAVLGSTAAVGEDSTPLPQCRPQLLRTVTAGTLTLAAPTDAAAPWFVGSPASGAGFESALGVAIAARLGYPATQLRWVRVPRSTLVAGTGKGFDAALAELRAPTRPGAHADYSTGYFDITDSVVTPKVAPRPAPGSVSAVGALRPAVVDRSTGQATMRAGGQGARLTSYPSAAAALAAVRADRVAAAVVDTPTALSATDLNVVGQLPSGRWQPDQLALALPAGSTLTSCVSTALDTLRAEGAIDRLTVRWLALKPIS